MQKLHKETARKLRISEMSMKGHRLCRILSASRHRTEQRASFGRRVQGKDTLEQREALGWISRSLLSTCKYFLAKKVGMPGRKADTVGGQHACMHMPTSKASHTHAFASWIRLMRCAKTGDKHMPMNKFGLSQ